MSNAQNEKQDESRVMQIFEIRCLKRGVEYLRQSGCRYYVKDSSGNEYGDKSLLITNPELTKKSRTLMYKFGELRDHVAHYLGSIRPGEKIEVPVDRYDIDSMQAACCNYMRKEYGIGSFMTNRGVDKKIVTVLYVSNFNEPFPA